MGHFGQNEENMEIKNIKGKSEFQRGSQEKLRQSFS